MLTHITLLNRTNVLILATALVEDFVQPNTPAMPGLLQVNETIHTNFLIWTHKYLRLNKIQVDRFDSFFMPKYEFKCPFTEQIYLILAYMPNITPNFSKPSKVLFLATEDWITNNIRM